MISVEIPNLKDILKQLPNEAKVKTVLARAINRSLPAARLAASKKVREEYVLKAGDINKATKITKANTATLSGKIRWSGPMTNLASYKISPRNRPKRRTKRQMTAEVKKGSRATYKGAFIGPNAKVFKRIGKKRLPIRPIYGPAISQLMGAEGVRKTIIEKTQDVLHKRVEHEVNRMMSK